MITFTELHTPVFQSRLPGGVALRYGDVGGYPLYGTGPGGFPRPGGKEIDGESATEEFGQEMGVHLGGCGDRGGGVRSDGNIHSEKAVCCDVNYYGPVRGSGE